MLRQGNAALTPPLGFPGGSAVKSLPADAGDVGSVPGSGRSPGEGNGHPLQYSCLKNPMDKGAWQDTAHGAAKRQTQLLTKQQQSHHYSGGGEANPKYICLLVCFRGSESVEEYQSVPWLVPTSLAHVCQIHGKPAAWDFPSSLVVKTSPSSVGDVSLIPGQGAKIPHASWAKK